MEYALNATLAQLRGLDRGFPGSFRRVYFGDEFCQRRLPSLLDLASVRRIFPGEMTLCTPPLTSAYLERAFRLASGAAARGLASEIVVNDLGLLARLAGTRLPGARLSAGRVLTGVLDCSLFSGSTAALFKGRVASFEADRVDTLVQALDGKERSAHFHAPEAYASAGRFCPFSGGFNGTCSHECPGEALQLKCEEAGVRMEAPLYLRGNAYFTDNRTAVSALGGISGLTARFPMVKRLVIAAGALRAGKLNFLKDLGPG